MLYTTFVQSISKVEHDSHNPVVCDFGVSKLKDDCSTVASIKQNAGTLAYQHREGLEGEKSSTATDVYSFGVVMGEVVTRKRAWDGMKGSVRKAILAGKFPEFVIAPENVCAIEIIKSCLQTPEERPQFREILPKLESMCDPQMIW